MPEKQAIESLQKAMALHQAGNLSAAESLYRATLALDPGNARALSMLGLARIQQESWEEGIGLMQASLEVNPRQPDVLNNLGYSLQLIGRHEEALTRFQQAIALNPDYVSAHFNLGNVLHDLQRYGEAAASYGKAVLLRPDYADAHVNLGNSLKELQRHEEALSCYDRALALMAFRADIHYNRGLVLQDLKRHKEAMESYNQAIQLDPAFTDAYANRAALFMDLGLMEEAEKSLDQALRLDAGHIPSHVMLSTLGRYTGQDERFNRLQALYERRENLPLESRIDLDFAMGKTLEKMGRFDDAFRAYDEGNQLYHSAHAYDDSAETELSDWSSSFFTRDLVAKYTVAAASLPDAERIPLFIVGMPRSGTSLIEQILASHPAVFGAGELKTLGKIVQQAGLIPHAAGASEDSLSSLRQAGHNYLDEVWQLAPDARYISDKMPSNYRYLGLIHLMLPNAKIIHAMRDPMDSCFSCYATRFKELNGYSYDLQTLGRHYLRYRKLMEHWHSVLPPGSILDVRYEEIVANPEQEVRRLLDHIGLPWDDACLKFHENKRVVQTASLAQVRQPIYSGSVARWKRFEKHLGPLLEIVGTAN